MAKNFGYAVGLKNDISIEELEDFAVKAAIAGVHSKDKNKRLDCQFYPYSNRVTYQLYVDGEKISETSSLELAISDFNSR